MNYSTLDDQTLLERIKTGDERAFNELFRRHHSFLRTTAYAVLKDKSLAHVLINEVLASIWIRKEKFDITAEKLNDYLFMAIKLAWYNTYRKGKNDRLIILSDDITSVMDAHNSFMPRFMEDKELGRKIEEAIETLSEPLKKAFVMFYIEQIPQKEIASELNLSLDAVRARISRASRSVQEWFRKNNYQ